MGTSHQGKQGGKLAGKVALITGGARGLGRGYALRLAGLGADIAIIDRDLGGAQVYEFERAQMTAETVTAECEALGVRAIGIKGDLTDRSATEAAVAQIVAALGGVDIAVCNAGGGVARFADERGASASDSGDLNTEATPADCPQDVLTRVLDINLMTCMYTCMAVAPHMKRRRAGKIVTVASSHGVHSRARYHPYGVAKAAIIHYTQSLAEELGPHNINVNAIAPAVIRTGRLGDRSAMAEALPLRREGTIEDCAKVVEFLATDLSDYVTGETILIGGGRR